MCQCIFIVLYRDGIFAAYAASGHGEDVRLPSASMRPCAGRQLRISGFPDCVNCMMALGGGEVEPGGGHDKLYGPGTVV